MYKLVLGRGSRQQRGCGGWGGGFRGTRNFENLWPTPFILQLHIWNKLQTNSVRVVFKFVQALLFSCCTYTVWCKTLLFHPTYLICFWTCRLFHVIMFSTLRLLIPLSRVLLEMPIVTQLVKKLPAFYGTWRPIALFLKVSYQSLSWATLSQSIQSHPISLRSILILFSRRGHLKDLGVEGIILKWILNK
jgi:hypothetical protein